jgi:hypothetical protein
MATIKISELSLRQKIQIEGKKSRQIIQLENYNVSETLILDQSDTVNRPLRFRGCIFDKIIFKNITCKESISFDSCCKFNKIEFFGCEFKKEVSFNLCQIRYEFKVENSAFSHLLITQTRIREGNIKIKSSTIGKFDINWTYLSGSLEFRESTFLNYIKVENLTANGGVSFIEGEYKGKVWFILGDLKGGVIFNNGIYHQAFKFDGTHLGRNLSIIGANFEKDLKFLMSTNISKIIDGKRVSAKRIANPPNEIFIENTTFNGGFGYEGSFNDEKTIAKIDIRCSKKLIGELSFNDTSINDLTITGSNHDSQIIFNELKTKYFRLSKFANYDSVQIHNVKPLDKDSYFEIKDSVLGKANFFNIDFNDFKKLIIKDSQLIDASFTNVFWPLEIYLEGGESYTYSANDYSKQKINYQQLQQVMKKQGDKPTSLEFAEKEWTAFRKYLSVDGIKRKNINDWIILWSNKSNDFGLNWWKPLILLLISNFVFYILIISCITPNFSSYYHYRCVWGLGLLNALQENFHMYWHFLNPAHNLKHFGEAIINNGWAMFWNVWIRLFNGYFIFQMVKAFRKYTS